MVYVSNDGTVLKNEPWTRRIVNFFLAIFYMFFMFFKSLANPVTNMLGSNSDDSSSYRSDGYSTGRGSGSGSGSGPPRPPRRIGRPNTGSGSGINTPGPCGGCGCG